MLTLLALAASSLAFGAAAGRPQQPEPKPYFGSVTIGVERQDFVDDASEERFWIDGSRESMALIVRDSRRRHPNSPMTHAYVSVCGVVSQPGAYGHLGIYRRKMMITKVVRFYETRPARASLEVCE